MNKDIYGSWEIVSVSGNEAWVKCGCGASSVKQIDKLESGLFKDCTHNGNDFSVHNARGAGRKKRDITGVRSGMLEAVKCVGRKSFSNNRKLNAWLCKCDCGNEIEVETGRITNKTKFHCGCQTKRGVYKHPLYSIFVGIKGRCYQKTNASYKNYGARGIAVCEEWRNDTLAFIEWAEANGWQQGLQIDRIDNDGNYEPSNCKWVDRFENNNNKRTNRMIEFHGVELSMVEWSRKSGINVHTIRRRLESGWEVGKALYAAPKKTGGNITRINNLVKSN